MGVAEKGGNALRKLKSAAQKRASSLPAGHLINAVVDQVNQFETGIKQTVDGVQDKVKGLEMGADDYLAKPFQMEELQARLRALLRRASAVPNTLLQAGPITLDMAEQTVKVYEQAVELTTFEYRLLELLMRHHGEVISKQTLTDYLYPHDDNHDSNVLEVMIGRLRRKLDPDGKLNPIETLRGRGYRFAIKTSS